MAAVACKNSDYSVIYTSKHTFYFSSMKQSTIFLIEVWVLWRCMFAKKRCLNVFFCFWPHKKGCLCVPSLHVCECIITLQIMLQTIWYFLCVPQLSSLLLHAALRWFVWISPEIFRLLYAYAIEIAADEPANVERLLNALHLFGSSYNYNYNCQGIRTIAVGWCLKARARGRDVLWVWVCVCSAQIKPGLAQWLALTQVMHIYFSIRVHRTLFHACVLLS